MKKNLIIWQFNVALRIGTAEKSLKCLHVEKEFVDWSSLSKHLRILINLANFSQELKNWIVFIMKNNLFESLI